MKSATLHKIRQTNQSGAESVKVIVRCRPYIERERLSNEHKEECVAMDKEQRQVSLYRPGTSIPG